MKEPLSGVQATHEEVQRQVEEFCRRFGKAKPPAGYPNIKAVLAEASLMIGAWGGTLAPTRMLGIQQGLVYPLLPPELGRPQQLEILERLWIAASIFRNFLDSVVSTEMKDEFNPEGVNRGILKIDERRKFIEFKEIEIHEIRNRRKIEMNH